MKRIKTLTLEEQQTVLDASRYAPDSRFRQRAHAVYLSDKSYRLDQLAEIFAVDRDTASAWLTAWDSVGLMGLRDRAHPGRPRRGIEADVEALEADLERAPQHIQALPVRFHERTGKSISLATVKRWLKKRH